MDLLTLKIMSAALWLRIRRFLHLISEHDYNQQNECGNYQLIKNSDFFSPEFYLEHNPDVKRAGVDPIVHYLNYGYKEARRCTPNFDGQRYVKYHPESLSSKLAPLLHYERYVKGRSQDEFLYIRDFAELDLKFQGYVPSQRGYLQFKQRLLRFGSAHAYKFLWLKRRLHLVSANTYRALLHYLDYQCIDNSIFFDRDYYLEHNPDVKASEVDPITHYLTYGYKECRICSPNFSDSLYVKYHPEVEMLKLPPLLHYEKIGKYRFHDEHLYVGNEFKFYTLQRELAKRALKIYRRERSEYSKAQLKELLAKFSFSPELGIVIPVYKPDLHYLQLAVASLQQQLYQNWHLYLVDDGSPADFHEPLVQLALGDKRISLKFKPSNSGIAETTNCAIALSKEDFIVFMDQDDALPYDALLWFVEALNRHPDADFIYSNECKLDLNGRVYDFYFKPDWSPNLLLTHMYVTHLTMCRKQLLERLGGLRKEYDFSQDYDLALRLSELTSKIYHVDRVLYYWRTLPSSAAAGGKDYAALSNQEAVEDYYRRQKLNYALLREQGNNYAKITYTPNPKVSMIIPAQEVQRLVDCVSSIKSYLAYPNYEIIAVGPAALKRSLSWLFFLKTGLRFCVCETAGFAQRCNAAIKVASGSVIVLLQESLRPDTQDFFQRGLDLLSLPFVGAVSPLVYGVDRHLTYGGMYVGTSNLMQSDFLDYHVQINTYGIFNHLLSRNTSVLCPQCLFIKKELFLRLGGFDPGFQCSRYAVADLSFTLRAHGLKLVVNPYARCVDTAQKESPQHFMRDNAAYFIYKCGQYLQKDSYFTSTMQRLFLKKAVSPFRLFLPDNQFKAQETSERYKQAQVIDLAQEREGGVRVASCLLISHELTLSGAPFALYNLAVVLRELGLLVVVMSPVNGPLAAEFLKLGIAVIVDKTLKFKYPRCLGFINNFDYVWINTLVLGQVAKAVGSLECKVFWWLHEGQMALDMFLHKIPKKIGDNVQVMCVGSYSRKVLQPYFRSRLDSLIYGLAEAGSSPKKKLTDTPYVKILVVGSIEPRKGQDLLLEALQIIDESYLSQLRITLIGRVLDMSLLARLKDSPYYNRCLFYKAELTHEQLIIEYQQAEAVICPSRDDPMPIVAAEALLFATTLVVSDACGTAHFITSGTNGYVYRHDQVAELADILIKLVQKRSELSAIGERGRGLFEQHFSVKTLQQRLYELLN